jgi:hypothetical protein
MRPARHVARMREKRNACGLLVGMDLGEVEWGDMDWIGLVRVGAGGELLRIRY